LFEVKIAFKEKGISKSFYSIQNSWPLQIFWKSCPYFKMACEKILQNLLCVSFKGLRKAVFFK
jgi:hypothetical protein